MPERSLESLVTRVAARLMSVDASTLPAESHSILRELVEFLGVDTSFLRTSDHTARVSILTSEWPVRENVPDPDPIGVVPFDSDPVFGQIEHMREPYVARPDTSGDDYQARIEEASGIPQVSLAMFPLLRGEVTAGVLGFVKFGDREYFEAEINALTAIASLLAQVQSRVEAEERLRFHAYHDDLTGLPNRRGLMEQLTEWMAPDQPGPVALLFLDLDRLKAMNDFLGHAAGDEFLRFLANRLRGGVRSGDLVARLGGDEFVVALHAPADTFDAMVAAERMLELANESVNIGGQSVSRSVSIGVAVASPHDTTVAQILLFADQAALAAKANGGNEIVLFTDEMRTQNEVRADIELHLRAAIGDGSLVLHYQPEIDLRSGAILGAEALVRWRHPTRGLLHPDSFIGIAEATNLAGDLGRWVLAAACRQLAEWRAEMPDRRVFLRVNVSPAELISVDFVDRVAEVLHNEGIPGGEVCLEITEHVFVRDIDRALVTLRGLKSIGVQVAIDDFGTGYSSFAQLKALPVDALKIDRGFVTDLGSSADDLAIVESIVGLAEAFGLELVAEGVQTPLAARTLRGLGCFRAQGYLFGRPVPADQMHDLIEQGSIDLPSLGLERTDVTGVIESGGLG